MLHGTKIQILLRVTLHNLCFRYFHKVDRNAKLSTCQLGRNTQKCQTKPHIRAYPLAEQASSKEQMTHIQTPNTQMDSYRVKEQNISKLPKHSAQTVGWTYCGTRTHRSLRMRGKMRLSGEEPVKHTQALDSTPAPQKKNNKKKKRTRKFLMNWYRLIPGWKRRRNGQILLYHATF